MRKFQDFNENITIHSQNISRFFGRQKDTSRTIFTIYFEFPMRILNKVIILSLYSTEWKICYLPENGHA